MTAARLSFVIEYPPGSVMPLASLNSNALGGRVIAVAIGNSLIDPASVRDDAQRLCEVLSVRERAVAALLLEGYRTPEVGKRLGITTKTVNSFRYKIHEKLGVRNDIQMVKVLMAGSANNSQRGATL
jgi:two-component system invasion response regulator UvrY